MSEPDVVRRLADIAATTVVDPEAWPKIRERIAELPPGRRHRRPVPLRLVVAAAAAVVVLGVAAILARGDDGGNRVRTAGDPTTTRAPDPPATSTSTAPPPAVDTSVPGSGSPVRGDPRPDGAADVGSPTGTSPGPPGTTTSLGPPAAATRLSPVGALSSTQGFEVELVYAANTIYVRRTDDVGSTPGPPDGYGSFDAVSWGEVSGAGCMTWGGDAYTVPGATRSELIVFGLVGSAATRFRVVMADGTPFEGPVGPVVEPGLRVWVANPPDGPIDHVEARDARNNLVASIADPTPGVPAAAQC